MRFQRHSPTTRRSTSAAASNGPIRPTIRRKTTERRLFADGRFFHADGRARMIFENPRPMPELPNKHYPLMLLTGRGSASQWHTQTRTKKSAVLRKLYPERAYVEINPADARQFNIRSNDRVLIQSQRGEVHARAFVTPTVQPGQVFVPMHYETANQLTDAVFDPYSKQPAYKSCGADRAIQGRLND